MLFRRIAAKTQTKEGQPQELFLTLSPGVKLYIRGLLLECFAEETEKSARNKIGDAVAEVARQLSDAGMCVWRGTLFHPTSPHFNQNFRTVEWKLI